MRARSGQDYSTADKSSPNGLGIMGGKNKDQMNSMFDTRGKQTESYQQTLIKALDENQKKYDRQLFSDWIVKVYKKCSEDCIRPSIEKDLSEQEKRCATNCIRKYDAGYKLYSKAENTIFTTFMETTEIDPDQFYSQMEGMTLSEYQMAKQS